jgi:hypothetical protein
MDFYCQGGITEEQMLMFMGANTHLSPLQAKTLLEVTVFSSFYEFHKTFSSFSHVWHVIILFHIYITSG